MKFSTLATSSFLNRTHSNMKTTPPRHVPLRSSGAAKAVPNHAPVLPCRGTAAALRHFVFGFLTALALIGLTNRAAAQGTVPERISFQGFMEDSTGTPLGQSAPVNLQVVFRIFPTATGGTASWAERQNVTFDKGRYSVLLGSGAQEGNEPNGSLSTLVRANQGNLLYVETTVTINGTPARISPRLRLVASPYALLATRALAATTADSATAVSGPVSGSQLSGSISGSLLADNSVNALKLANNSVTALQLANNAVTTAKLTNGSVTTAKIADGAVTSAKYDTLDATKLTGEIPANSVPSNVARKDTGNTFTGDQLVRGSLTVTNNLFVDTPANGVRERVATGLLNYRILAGAVRITGSAPKFFGGPNPTQTPTPVPLDFQGGGFTVNRVLIDPSTNGTPTGGSIVIGNYSWVAGCEIVFDEPFAAFPIITVTASTDRGGSNGSSRFWTVPKVEYTSRTNAVVTFYSPNNANVLDSAFHFIVVGQR